MSEFQSLLEHVRTGSEEAVWELLEQYGPHVLRVIRRMLSRELRSKYDSADFAQAIWMSFLCHRERLCRFDTPDDLVRFLCGATRNKLRQEYRRQFTVGKRDIRRERPILDVVAPAMQYLLSDEPSPSAFAIARERWKCLESGLSQRDREILRLRYLGHSYLQIAEALTINEKTVRRVLDRLYLKAEL